MDAVEFVKERRRMFYTPGVYLKYSMFNTDTCVEDVVKEVEEWAAKHPLKTRQRIFLEQHQETKLDEYGVIMICPAMISSDYRDINGGCHLSSDSCYGCRRKFWMEKVK